MESADSWRRGRTHEALRRCEECLELDPALAEGHALAAKLRFWAGDLAGSRRCVDRAAEAGYRPDRVAAMLGCLERAVMSVEESRHRERRRREATAHWSGKWSEGWRNAGLAIRRLRAPQVRAGAAFVAILTAVFLLWRSFL